MKLKYLWLTEFLIWLLIISAGIFGFIYTTRIKNNSKNTYYVFFDDAGGIIKGSAVRLMGINIGYIKDVKIFDNKVFVSFVVTKNNIEIPKCATATIEFYGLGGSVSVELNPITSSDTDNTTEEIIPAKSYRVQDYYDSSALDAQVLIDYYGRLGRKTTNEDILKLKPYAFQSELLKQLNKDSEEINKSQTVIIRKLERNNKIRNEKRENMEEQNDGQ